MELKSFSSTSSTCEEVMDDIVKKLGDSDPSLIIMYLTVTMPIEKILSSLSKKYPTSKVAGTTSCKGVMTDQGFKSESARGLGGMAFYSSPSDYGIGFAPVEGDSINVKLACERSLQSADKSGVLPVLTWMLASPGHEELCLNEMKDYFGCFIPTFGGSSADNDISGKWWLFANGNIHDSGLIVVTFFDIPKPYYSFRSGYQQTEFQGKVTRSNGRELIEINNRPAGEVYNEWTGGILDTQLKDINTSKVQNILSLSSLHPIARIRGEVGTFPYYLLSHPEALTSQKSIQLFTRIEEGDDIFLMEGSIESLQQRASEVIKSTIEREGISKENIAGALIIFCAGCMLTISSLSSMQPVVEGIKKSLGDKPFLGAFTFGEQGCFLEDDNFHGNLMISVTIFCKD